MVVLPDSDSLSVDLLDKLEEWLHAGVCVYAPQRPERALGQHPQRNAQVRERVAALWGNIDGRKVTHRRVGKGLLIHGMPLAEATRLAGIKPDFTFANADGTPVKAYQTLQGLSRINFIHRRDAGADYYFVANYTPEHQQLIGRFAVTGRAPQWWDPVNGDMKRLATWREVDGTTEIPLNLGPAESVFIVFPRGDQAGKAGQVVSVTRDGKELFPAFRGAGKQSIAKGDWELTVDAQAGLKLRTAMAGSYAATTAGGKRINFQVPPLPRSLSVTGPWQVEFEPGLGAPAKATFPELISWSEHPDEGIRYFSGHATYHNKFKVPPDLLGDDRRVLLDLGEVEVAASVRVNGNDLGILWHAPYEIDVTDVLKPGENSLTIRVVNLWPNRLIGDQRLPKEKRISYSVEKFYNATDDLLPSGLLGLVVLRVESVLASHTDI